jgi:hypothetical protein
MKHQNQMSGRQPTQNANVWHVTRGQKRVEDARRRAYDPRVPPFLAKKDFARKMDCRVTPGNDGALNALIPGYDRSRDFTRHAEFHSRGASLVPIVDVIVSLHPRIRQ